MKYNVLHEKGNISLWVSGAKTDLKNKEGKTALDLARDPASAALLQRTGELSTVVKYMFCLC